MSPPDQADEDTLLDRRIHDMKVIHGHPGPFTTEFKEAIRAMDKRILDEYNENARERARKHEERRVTFKLMPMYVEVNDPFGTRFEDEFGMPQYWIKEDRATAGTRVPFESSNEDTWEEYTPDVSPVDIPQLENTWSLEDPDPFEHPIPPGTEMLSFEDMMTSVHGKKRLHFGASRTYHLAKLK
jgi:hypothetical protein